MNIGWHVFLKELKDALRDRRTLMAVLMSSVMMGPLMLFALSTLVEGMEKRAEAREVFVAGIDNAPGLRNYLERQTWKVLPAPADYERALERSQLGDPVLVVAKNFEADLVAGERPLLEIVTSSANQRADGAAGRLEDLVQGYAREQAGLRLMVRGVAPMLLQPMQVERRDLANPAARAARLTGMLPFFVLMAVLYGALNAALDTTTGERERGSLEPLLMNPATRLSLVVGKWGAVAAVGMLVAILSSLSFLPSQMLFKSEQLAALFRYDWPEALAFLGLLLPLAGALAAVLMAIAIRCKTFKEAQASSTVVVLVVSLLPMLTLFNQDGEKPWHLWVPALAQSTLMSRVLKGEFISTTDMLVPAAACAVLAAVCVVYIARQFQTTAVR